jgi:preprotein translocase subunit SecY
MNLRILAQKIAGVIPTVSRPRAHVSFKKKALWTIGILVMYFVLTNVPLFGVGESSDAFGQFRGILAGAQGSLLQLGIMPIVTASIVLQILTGTDAIPLNLNDERDQNFYQSMRRLLIVTMVIVNAFPIVFTGSFLSPSRQVAAELSTTVGFIQVIIFAQVVAGGLLIYYMDEVISKWGIGSGLGLFIIAGVSQRLVGGIFSQLIPGWVSVFTEVQLSFSVGTAQSLLLGPGNIIPLITTILIFAIVVYAESTNVQIPINRAKTAINDTYDIKLVYASVLPIILVRAIQANLRFVGQTLDGVLGSNMPAWLGQYNADGQVLGGIFYFFTPILRPEDWMWWMGTTTVEPWMILIRLLVDITIMTVGGAVFAVFWIKTTNKDADSIAKQLQQEGAEIPGFRSSPKQMQRVLERYIPYITILGGALIGAVAVAANMLGTIGGVGGTGLLLAVSITYKIYEEVAEEMVRSQMGSRLGLGRN